MTLFGLKYGQDFNSRAATPPPRIPRSTSPSDVYQIFNNMYVNIKNSYLVFFLPILAFNQPESQGEREGACSGFQVMGMIDGIFWV